MHVNDSGLILLPNLLSYEASYKDGFIEMLRPEILKLSGLFIESQKGGRAFMSLFKEPSLLKFIHSVVWVTFVTRVQCCA